MKNGANARVHAKNDSHSMIKYRLGSLRDKSCRRTASSPAGYILYCNIFIIKPYNIGHTDLMYLYVNHFVT